MTRPKTGWLTKSLGSIGVWRGGGTPSKAVKTYWENGMIPWVSPKDMKRDLIDSSEDHITQAAVESSATQMIPKNSVLVVTRSGILKHTLPVAINTKAVAINQDLKALTVHDGFEPAFVAMYLRSHAQTILADCAKAGTTVDSVDFDKLKAFPVPLPPLAEQRRIVAKLDSLTARTARARSELDHIPKLIAKYKQAILAKAFSGELTEEWRGARGFSAPKMDRLEEFVLDIRYGTAQKCDLEPIGTAVLRIPNIASGRIDLTELKYAELDSRELEKLRLVEGDILVVRSNGSVDLVGRPALVSANEAGLAFAGYLIRLRPNKSKILPAFLAQMINSPQTRNAIELGARSSSGVHNVNGKELANLEVPCPGLLEQQEIVRRIETAFTWLDKVAAEHARAAHLLPKLDQGILAKAFRGELVPQDPNDEPASVLLDRIKAEREITSSGGGRGRKRTAKNS